MDSFLIIDYVGGLKDEIMKSYNENCRKKSFMRSQVVLGKLSKELMEVSVTLLSLVPNSASIERGFSTMGYTHSELRNRLSHVKVHKISFCQRMLKKN